MFSRDLAVVNRITNSLRPRAHTVRIGNPPGSERAPFFPSPFPAWDYPISSSKRVSFVFIRGTRRATSVLLKVVTDTIDGRYRTEEWKVIKKKLKLGKERWRREEGFSIKIPNVLARHSCKSNTRLDRSKRSNYSRLPPSH